MKVYNPYLGMTYDTKKKELIMSEKNSAYMVDNLGNPRRFSERKHEKGVKPLDKRKRIKTTNKSSFFLDFSARRCGPQRREFVKANFYAIFLWKKHLTKLFFVLPKTRYCNPTQNEYNNKCKGDIP